MSDKTPIDALAEAHDSDGVVLQSVSTIAALAKSDAEAQLDAAHKYQRSITKFLREATALATVTREVAESCLYSVPRGGKMIAGPSVRLAEICASSYGNLHVGARVIDIESDCVVSQGVAWDLEKNLRVSVEVRRKILDRNGRRFNEDMIIVTGNAAASIALRNAIFRVVPRALVDQVYLKAKQVATGDAQTMDARRVEWMERLQKMGIAQDRVLGALGCAGLPDIDFDKLAVLIGLANAVRNGDKSADEAFPPVATAPAAPAQDGQRVKPEMKPEPKKEPDAKPAEAKPEPKPATKADAPPPPPPERKRTREPGED
jgi:hypothetical protein